MLPPFESNAGIDESRTALLFRLYLCRRFGLEA